MRIEKSESGGTIRLQCTKCYKGLKLIVRGNGNVLFEKIACVLPGAIYQFRFPAFDCEYEITITDSADRPVMHYKEEKPAI
ncbi:MAG: hypothetical protein LBQ48_00225, partial [Oscillospiraceae bacterium]|nr:hypothetical protein [Oscillospiraceae bacterium]